MKKSIFSILVAIALIQQGCTDAENKVIDTPEVVTPSIAYVKIDTVLAYNKHFLLDLNHDSRSDYHFSSWLVMEENKPYLYLQVKADGSQGNKILLEKESDPVLDDRWAYPLEYGLEISETPASGRTWSGFINNGYIINVTDDCNQQFGGLWKEKKDRYLGIRTVLNGKVHYGWIRMSHQKDQRQIIIHDLAYNLVPGQSIRAGQKTL